MRDINKNLNEKCGIYIITNLINGKRYIGSAKNLRKRLYDHVWDLDKKIHPNNYLQNSWNKYGKDNFEYGILEYCEENTRLIRETFYINTLNPEYNLNGVNLNSIQNHSEETKKKISSKIKESYKNGKLKEKLENSIMHKYDCYVYSIENWKLVKHFDSFAEASVFIVKNRFDLRMEDLGKHIFNKKYVVLRELINNEWELKNIICKNAFKYISQSKEDIYLIGEKEGVITYFKSIPSLVSFYGVSSRSTLVKHKDATKDNPYIPRNTNIKIYWSKEFIPYRPSIDEKSNGLLQDNIGEGCDANTEITEENKESLVS